MLNRVTVLCVAALSILIFVFVKTNNFGAKYDEDTSSSFSLQNTVQMLGWPQKVLFSSRETPEESEETIISYFDNMSFGMQENPQESELGQLGLIENYYAEFSSLFTILKPINITAIVFALDGFKLVFDGREILSANAKDEFTEQRITFPAEIGAHIIELHYFRGAGPEGLDVYYLTEDEDGWFFIGESSKALRFKAMN